MLSEIQELTTDAKEIRQNGHQQEEDSVFALSYILVMLEAARKCCGARPFSVSSRATLAPDLQRKRFKFNTDFFFFTRRFFSLKQFFIFFSLQILEHGPAPDFAKMYRCLQVADFMVLDQNY